MFNDVLLEGMRGSRQEVSEVSYLFFHPENVASIHTSLRYAVYVETGKVIDPQSSNEITNIMRTVYKDFERGLRGSTLERVKTLNSAVVQRAAREIVNAMQFHLWYLSDVAKPNPVPQSRGEYVSSKGTRELRFPHFDSMYWNNNN
jgi:hypothetical protein